MGVMEMRNRARSQGGVAKEVVVHAEAGEDGCEGEKK